MIMRKILWSLAVVAVVSDALLFPIPKAKLAFKKKVAFHKKVAVAAGLGAGAAVLGGAAGLAYVVQQQQQQQDDTAQLYTPEAGSLSGQTILITGGTTGLGLETAKRLARGTPAQIIITARTAAKGDIALADIRTYMKQNNVDTDVVTLSYKVLDLDDIQGIQEAVRSWIDDLPTINALVNNAGIMALPNREVTIDGIERQMQSNHLGHFVLTALLAPKFAKDARIVNVSSAAHMIAQGGMDFDYCWTGQPNYGAWKSYGQSKLANILFSQELQRRADQANLDWKISCLHPGGVNTDLGRNVFGLENWERLKDLTENSLLSNNPIVQSLSSAFLKTPQQGASTSIYLAAGATSPDEPRARYYVDCKPVTLSAFARDATAAKRLWEESEARSGVQFDLLPDTIKDDTETVANGEVVVSEENDIGSSVDDGEEDQDDDSMESEDSSEDL